MTYILKRSDGTHTVLGQSEGNRQNEPDNSFWITGWSPDTRSSVSVGGFYTLVFPDRHSNSVNVKEIGGEGMGGIRFKLNQ